MNKHDIDDHALYSLQVFSSVKVNFRNINLFTFYCHMLPIVMFLQVSSVYKVSSLGVPYCLSGLAGVDLCPGFTGVRTSGGHRACGRGTT